MAKKTRRKSTTPKNPARGPLARKLIAEYKKHLENTVTDLASWKEGKANAEKLQESIVSDSTLKQYDPLHALYIYGQNQLSVLIEQIINLELVDYLGNIYDEQQTEHMPSGPPQSPLTGSFFTCWGSFDLCTKSAKKETLASIAIDFCKAVGVDQSLIDLYETMQQSRMGIYIHQGTSGRFLYLREMITGKEIKAICASGYLGQPGELWFVRIMPPLSNNPVANYSVVFTTPYLLTEVVIKEDRRNIVATTETKWQSYFDRNLGYIKASSEIEAYEQLMKYGPNPYYWSEYIFLAYCNSTPEMICLTGIPDIIESLPHGEMARDTLRI
jgi:hypothetical protein